MSILQTPREAIRGYEPDCGSAELRYENQPEAARIVAAAIAILTQGESLLRTVTVDTYTRRVPSAFNARIGEHYRHCLDHFTSLVRGVTSGVINYDSRERDPRVESDLAVALDRTAELRSEIGQLSPATWMSTTFVQCEVSYGASASPLTHSTLLRELVYVIAHSIHHYALIATMCRLMECRVPEDFGFAPSTVAHNARRASR